ncbi:MAG: hypothetical protein GDA50_02515 [Alphaproteobacteria bacterium GM202ARS2]|nr:hypothetical protein [Alphaproteobacteria bacterium GM202ARS2]
MTTPTRSKPEDMARLAARLFSSDDGEQMLHYLDSLTYRRVLAADCPCRVLRHLEGQRFLVAHLRALIARGRQP